MGKYLLGLFLVCFGAINSYGATFTSIATGNFGVSTTWSFVGFDVDGVPDNSDDVTISAGHTVTLNVSSNAKNLTIDPTGRINLNSKVMLVWGNLTNNGTSMGIGTWSFRAAGTYSGNPINNLGTMYFYAAYSIAPGVVLSKPGGIILFNNVHVTNNGNINMTSSGVLNIYAGGVWTNNSNSSLGICANIINNGTIDCSAVPNTVTYSTAAYSTIMCTNSIYYNLTLSSPAAATKTLNNTLSVLNDFTISASVTTNCNNKNIAIGGSWTNSAGTNCTNMATVTLNGSGAQTISRPASTERFNHLTCSSAGSVTLAKDVICTGNFTLNSGTFDVSASNFSLTIAGNFGHFGGTFTGRNGTVTMNGAVAQGINGFVPTTFYNLTSSNTIGGVTVNEAITVSNILSVTTTSFNANVPSGGSVTISATGSTTAGRIAPLGATASLLGTGWTIQCFINGPAARNWQYLGTPINGNSLSDWDNDTRFYMSGVGGNDGNACCPIFRSVRTFNSATNAWVNVTSLVALTNCQGYSVWMADNNTTGLTSPLIFDSKGTPNFGNQSIAVFGSNRYTLASNPYACPVTYATVVAASSGVGPNFMCWQESGSYVTNPNGGTIAGTQGFMALGTAAGTLQFTEASKTIVANPNVIRQGEQENYLRIRASNDVNGLGGETDLRILSDAVNGYDIQDMPYLASMFEDATNIWTTDEAGTDQLLNAVDGSREKLDVPLTLLSGSIGNQMVYFSGLNKFSEYSCATLEDITTGEKINLKEKDNYTYAADQVGDKREFIIHLSRNGECPLNQQNIIASLDAQTLVFVSNNQLMAKFNFEENTAVDIAIFDIDGRQVSDAQQMTVSNESIVLPSPGAHGIYFVRITSGDKVSTKKIYY